MANPPGPRWLLAMIALAVMLIATTVPAVSAETIIDETFTIDMDTSYSHSFPRASTVYQQLDVKKIRFWHIEDFTQMYYVDIVGYPHGGTWPDNAFLAEGRYETTYTLGGQTKDAVIYVTKNRDILGTVISTKFTIFFDNWDIGELVGAHDVTLGTALFHSGSTDAATSKSDTVQLYGVADYGSTGVQAKYDLLVTSSLTWQNHLNVILNDDKAYEISLNRNLLTISSPSKITGYQDGDLVFTNHSGADFSTVIGQAQINMINISPGSQAFTFSRSLDIGDDIGDDIPDNNSVTVYVQSSQTGALLADAQLSILASAGGTEVEIINATLPGGTATYNLQPTGGGLPNPDYYRAYATVPGYTQIIENHSFTLTGPHDVIIEMRPDSGGPTDPENTYLEFYVRDINANPIPSATVECAGLYKQTNSQGYALYEVAKNSTYPYTVRKTNYMTISGTATVADGPRYVVNVVLGPGSVPTYTPTPDPSTGETPGATPTPDHRTNEQKGQAVIDMIADNAEGIGALALICLLMGLLKLLAKW